MSTGRPIWETYLPESPSVEPLQPGQATSGGAKPAAYKIILSTPDTSSTSLVMVNLLAVAVGTLKLFAWAAVISIVTVGAFMAGMIKASSAHRRRHW